MGTTAEIGISEYLVSTAELVSAYVSNNSIRSAELPELISSVHAALIGRRATNAPVVEPLTPAVPIKKSITDEYLISLEDGKRYKSLKRHLSGRGLTPAQYREKWGLKVDYPMVSPSYSRQRSDLAKALGLGERRRKTALPEAVEATSQPKRRGRPKKAA